VPYSESWILAHRIHRILQEAGELKKGGNPEQAKEKVRSDAVPLVAQARSAGPDSRTDFPENRLHKKRSRDTGFHAQ